jgi:hypothetical protein
LLKVINNDLVPPEWLVVAAISIILAWGFSKRTVVELVPEEREKTEVSK